jgi:hypothetical protein
MSGDGKRDGGSASEDGRREPPAKARNAERFERQAAALRENLRRRKEQQRTGTARTPDKPEN